MGVSAYILPNYALCLQLVWYKGFIFQSKDVGFLSCSLYNFLSVICQFWCSSFCFQDKRRFNGQTFWSSHLMVFFPWYSKWEFLAAYFKQIWSSSYCFLGRWNGTNDQNNFESPATIINHWSDLDEIFNEFPMNISLRKKSFHIYIAIMWLYSVFF